MATAKRTTSGKKPAKTATKRISFNLSAPEAQEVILSGSFNGWDPKARALKCDKKGVWRTWLNLPSGQYEYRYIANGHWQEDPSCNERLANPYGSHNSVVKV